MDNNNYKEIMNKANEEFVEMATDKDLFSLSIHRGKVVPMTDPRYYDGYVMIKIKKDFTNNMEHENKVEIEKDTYTIDNETIDRIIDYTTNNLDRLINITLNQGSEVFVGGSNNIIIKYKSILLFLDTFNAKNNEDREFLEKYIEDILNIILKKENI